MVTLALHCDLTTYEEQDTARVSITTTRFGTVDIARAQLWHFPEGVLGFDAVHEYCILPHAPDSPFFWLQATTEPGLAFVLVQPFAAFADYDFEISDADVVQLGLESVEDVSVFTIVTIGEKEITTNLMGPVILNRRTHLARQIVLADPRYGTRHPLCRISE